MKLDHIVLLVSDMETCIGFYDVLLPLIGFQKSKDHVYGNKDGLFLDLRQAQKPSHGYERYAPGLNHLGFTAPNRGKIVELGKAMAEASFEVPEIQEFQDGSALFLRDRDGMRVEISCYL